MSDDGHADDGNKSDKPKLSVIPGGKPVGEDTLKTALGTPVKRFPARGRKKGAAPPPESPKDEPKPCPKNPDVLPDDAPVTALGTCDGDYFFLDYLGQMRVLKDRELGRLAIVSLFGGDDYLKATWPLWEQDKDTHEWKRRNKFDHDAMGPALIRSCTRKGVWNAVERVRGVGGWQEADGAFVMHCGERLYVAKGTLITTAPAGMHDDVLYPRRPALPEPDLDDSNAGLEILEKLSSWAWRRGDADAAAVLGWLTCGMLGQANQWRPNIWVTGPKGNGKSTLVRLLLWLLGGKQGAVCPTDTSPAYIYQTLGNSSLPLLLDEMEPNENNGAKLQSIVEIMRVSASGGEIGRGGSDSNAKTFTVRSACAAFSILVPSLRPQDISRTAILNLDTLQSDPEGFDAHDAPQASEYDIALGYRAKWGKLGRSLRGRILRGWARYLETYSAYRLALMRAGLDARGADLYGALGTGYDLAVYDKLNPDNVTAWVKLIDPAKRDEAREAGDEPTGCLQWLLGSKLDRFEHGQNETVSNYIQTVARQLHNPSDNGSPDAARELAKIGIRVVADRACTYAHPVTGRQTPVLWLDISNTHRALMEIFTASHWKGRSGAKGGWARALAGLPYADGQPVRARIDGALHWCTRLQLLGVYPNIDKGETNDGQGFE